jgi:hypothetical protein
MFNKIKDFITVFKVALNEVNKEKFLAKEAMSEYTKKLSNIECVKTEMKEAFDKLSNVYSYLPKTERKDYIQKSLDLLKYGRPYKDETFNNLLLFDQPFYFDGFFSFYENMYLKMKENLKEMRAFYKIGLYKEVIEMCKEYTNELEHFYITLGVIDEPTEKEQ